MNHAASDWTAPFSHLAPAARLRRLADAELAHGHALQAELLEGQAAALPTVLHPLPPTKGEMQ